MNHRNHPSALRGAAARRSATKGSSSFGAYVVSIIRHLKLNGKRNTAARYRTAINSFNNFLASQGENDIPIGDITPGLIADFEIHLHAHGIRRNTSSAYMRSLRAAYNKAAAEGITPDRNPFGGVYTGIDKTRKRAIPLADIAKIRDINLPEGSDCDFARDMFLISFYLRGMSFVDMSYLKKSDLVGNEVSYRRRKTGRELVVKRTAELNKILGKYPPNPTEYLLPIIKSDNSDGHYAYLNALGKVNRSLKSIAARIGLETNLTHYVARHSWASAAQSQQVPLRIISEAMGHESETTTAIYLASLHTSEAIDRANDTIIRALDSKCR